MSLNANKKVKATLDIDEDCLVRCETIYERNFEFDVEAYDLETLNESHYITFDKCLMMGFPAAESLLKLMPKLHTLIITTSNLARINSQDLEGFGCLKDLTVDVCEIEELPGDLFIHTPNLENISFVKNKIKVIGEEILDPLINLKSFNLSFNPGINAWYHATHGGKRFYETLDQLTEAIKRCKSTQDVSKVIDELKKQIVKLQKMCTDQNAQIDGIKKDNEALKKELTELKQAGAYQKFNFTIKVKERNFKVQKEVLIANSPLLAQMIRENKDADTLELKDICEATFEEILSFMHSKQPPKPTANFIELYAASGRLQMKELMDLCAEKLMGKVTRANAFEILSLSEKYQHIQLQKKALEEYKKKFQ